ncbi:MAG TPA: alkaline phosphatase family protein, partial [Rubrobacteraceae bacterium]|nr:alkaline phosphatase family protein [Rubrobacteraceae bacterium]
MILGPLLRHVGPSDATVWVETDAACEVEVRAGKLSGRSPTFAVEGHHYALVVITGLEPGSVHDYEVLLDGEVLWPEAGSPLPPSTIRTILP